MANDLYVAYCGKKGYSDIIIGTTIIKRIKPPRTERDVVRLRELTIEESGLDELVITWWAELIGN